MMSVTITGEHRDALYALIVATIGEAEDLERATQTDDLEACYTLGRRLHDALRLIVDGGLGWGYTTGQEAIHLSLPDDELAPIIFRLRKGAIHLQEAIRPEYEEKLKEWAEAQLAREACDEALARVQLKARTD